MSFPIKQSEKKIVILRSKRLSEMKRFALSVEKRNELEENYKKHYNLLRDCERSIEKEESYVWQNWQNMKAEYEKKKHEVLPADPPLTTPQQKSQPVQLSLFD